MVLKQVYPKSTKVRLTTSDIFKRSVYVMKKKLSILLAAAMILALASCGTGSQTPGGSTSSAGSASTSGSAAASSEASSGSSTSSASSEEPDVMDTLNWMSNLPDPGEGITYMEINDADTVVEIYMDENWTVETAKEYVAQCLEIGFELYDEAEPNVGIYYSEGYNLKEKKGFLITCGFEDGGADIVLTYGDQMYIYG